MPSRQLFANNARATLAAGISSGATTVTVNAGEGARFGASPGANEFQLATLRNSDGTITEIVKITSRTGDALTITRAQEGTTAAAFTAGDTISLRWTAAGATGVAQKDANETITGLWSFPAPTLALHPATKNYVDTLRGRILQIVHATDAGSSHSFTSFTNLNNSVKTITPLSATSKILIEVAFHGGVGIASANTDGTFQIYETPSLGLGFTPVLAASLAALGAASQAPCFIRHRVDSVGLSPRSFGLWGRQSGGALVSATKMVWTLTEYIE